MPKRVNIYFSREGTLDRLRAFVHARYGGHKAFSITIEQAVIEYLEKEQILEKIKALIQKHKKA